MSKYDQIKQSVFHQNTLQEKSHLLSKQHKGCAIIESEVCSIIHGKSMIACV